MMETSTRLDHEENLTRGAPDLRGPGTEEEQVGLRAVVGSVLLLLIVSTLLGNTLVCAAVVKFHHLRSKVTNVFVVSLAVSDLLLALLVMPWEAVTTVTGQWLLGGFCSVWIACDIMCSTASILNLCIISLDRYWAISSPFRYERRMTHRVAFLLIGMAWTLSILISFIPVHLNWHRAAEEGNSTSNATEGCVANLNKTYAVASSLISFYIPVGVMLATYTRIYRIAQTQIRRIAALERGAGRPQEPLLKTSFRKETKVLKTLSVIMGVFVGCWSPFFLLNCTLPFCQPPCVSDTAFTVSVWFGWANSSLNPVIYAFNADFRRAFSTLLGCGRVFSSNAVEAVDLSVELVSYRHDTTLHRHSTARDPAPDPARDPALHHRATLQRDAPLHPHSTARDPARDPTRDPTRSASSASLVSASSRSHKDHHLLPALVTPRTPPGTPC